MNATRSAQYALTARLAMQREDQGKGVAMDSSVSVHSQVKRLLRLSTPLGLDALVPLDAAGDETLSEGFHVTVTAASETFHKLRPVDLIGKMVTLAIIQADNSTRCFNGYVTDFAVLGRLYGGQRSVYRFTLRPWLHLLEHMTDCRIFQELSVPDVLREIFAELGDIAQFRFDLHGAHAPHRYLTQYNESHGNFMRRLLAMDGIGFFFEQQEGAHTVCFFDTPSQLPDLSPERDLKLQSATADDDHLVSWTYRGQLVAGRFAQRAYSYLKPAAPLSGSSEAPAPVLGMSRAAGLEHYSFSERYATEAAGHRDTSYRMMTATARHHVATGYGSYRHLQVGRHFSVRQVPGGEWLHTGEEFTLSQLSFSASDIDDGIVFSVHLEAVPKGTMLLPRAEQTRVSGLQTALVTGPPGEELFTDRLGRIRARFHWDRDENSVDEKATCWLRVMQSFAGPGFGAHFTPRIGQEVVVAFENGNPDRPFVIGSLYHAEHLPPYADRQGTRNGIRTHSTKGGGTGNCNELYFEDELGREEVWLQAERDLNAMVKRDESRQVGNDQQLTVVHDQSVTIGNNAAHGIGRQLRIQAGESITLQVGGSVIEITPGKIALRAAVVDIDGGSVQIN